LREYNYLVESNLKINKVADYAEMLNKSPKHYLIYSKNTTKITFTNYSRPHDT
jgi:hypothetical protein